MMYRRSDSLQHADPVLVAAYARRTAILEAAKQREIDRKREMARRKASRAARKARRAQRAA